MPGLAQAVRRSRLQPLLFEAVNGGASRVNRCAYRLDSHSKDARAQSEEEQRLHDLAGRQAPVQSSRAGGAGLG